MATITVQTDLTVINQALTGWLGEDKISNLATDQTKKAIVSNIHYQSVSEECQARQNWRFNTVKKALNKNTAVPTNRWAASWKLPTDMLKLITTWPISEYEILGGDLYCNNTSAVEIDYLKKLEENYWPAWFTRFVVIRFAMRICRGVTGEMPSQEMSEELATARADAFFQDSQQQPNQTMMANDFVDCRN